MPPALLCFCVCGNCLFHWTTGTQFSVASVLLPLVLYLSLAWVGRRGVGQTAIGIMASFLPCFALRGSHRMVYSGANCVYASNSSFTTAALLISTRLRSSHMLSGQYWQQISGFLQIWSQTSLNLREGLFHRDRFVPFGASAILASWKFTPSHAVHVCCSANMSYCRAHPGRLLP